MSGFQKVVNAQPALGVEGDWAGNNPRASLPPVVAGAYKVAPGQSVRVGYFAWAGLDGLVYSSAAAAGAVGVAGVGFVQRSSNEPSALITAFLGESVMTLQAGLPCTLITAGDVYGNFAAGAAANVAVYATAATGAPTTTAGGNTATTFKTASVARAPVVTDNATVIAADTGIMTVAVVSTGGNNIQAGDRVTGAGAQPFTVIERQISGTPGGAGTYQTSSRNRAAVAAFVATMVQGTLAKMTSYN